MEQIGKLQHQLYPKGINSKGRPLKGGTMMYNGVVRIISLAAASSKKKVALAVVKDKVCGQVITTASSINDKWRMVNFSLNGNFFLYHCQTGLFLAVQNGKLQLVESDKLPSYDSYGILSPGKAQGVWKQGKRTIFLVTDNPTIPGNLPSGTGYCVTGNSPDIEVGDLCDTSNSQCPSGSTCRDINDFCVNTTNKSGSKTFDSGTVANFFGKKAGGSDPDAAVYLNISMDSNKEDGHYSIKFGNIDSSYRAEKICTGVIQTDDGSSAGTFEWYILPQEDISNEGYTIPQRSGLSTVQLLCWDPENDQMAKFGRSLEPLRQRFVDKSTQIEPNQSYQPFFMFMSSSPGSGACNTQYNSGTLFGDADHSWHFGWAQTDLYAYFGGNQPPGSPPEFDNLTPEHMGVPGDFSKDVPGFCTPPKNTNCQNGNKTLGKILEGNSEAYSGARFTIPPKWMIDASHKNGTKVFGCGPFMQEIYYGGQWKWWQQMFQDPILLAHKMVDIAVYYGFDGWLTNFETGPTDPGYTSQPYAGQSYAGVNYFNKKPTQTYWCNQAANTKFDNWYAPPANGDWGQILSNGLTLGGSTNKDGTWNGKPVWKDGDRFPCLLANEDGPHGPGYSQWPYSPGEENGNLYAAKSESNCDWKNGTQCTNAIALRNQVKKFLREFRNYRNKLGVRIEINVYDTQQVTTPFAAGISRPKVPCDIGTGNCYGNYDFWVDDDGTALVDYIYTMNSGQVVTSQTEPGGVTNTYIYSKNNDIREDYIREDYIREDYIREDYDGHTWNVDGQHLPKKPGWPKNTGLKAPGNVCDRVGSPNKMGMRCTQSSDCGEGASCNFVPLNDPSGPGFCAPKPYSDFYCNFGIAPKETSKLSLQRPFDYWQIVDYEAESFEGQVKSNLDSVTRGDFSKFLSGVAEMAQKPNTWFDMALYCGKQADKPYPVYGGNNPYSGKCDNYKAAVERPLASIGWYSANNLEQGAKDLKSVVSGAQNLVDIITTGNNVIFNGGDLLGKNKRANLSTLSAKDYWKGIGFYVTARSAIQQYPFYTSFSLGTGQSFYVGGDDTGLGPWSNWSMQDILPTWQWWPIEKYMKDARFIRINYDMQNVWHKSQSLQFTYNPTPSTWLRERTDCKSNTGKDCNCGESNCGDQSACTKSGQCCFDSSKPGDKPWCYIPEGGEPVDANQNKFTAAYRLYKTKLSLRNGCEISAVVQTSFNSSVAIGYSLGSSPMNARFSKMVTTDGKWRKITLDLGEKDDDIVTICLKVQVHKLNGRVKIGELSAIDYYKPVFASKPKISASHTTTKTKQRSVSLSWKTQKDVEYYRVYEDNTLLGLAYQGFNPRDGEMVYSLRNLSPNSKLYVVPFSSRGPTFNAWWSWKIILAVLLLVLSGILIFWTVREFRAGSRYMYLGSILVILCVVLFLVTIIYNPKRIPDIEENSRSYSVETWQHCRRHAFNACFDDARVKCWRWLVHWAEKRKWPIKFTFFYNTLWLLRDWNELKKWIGMGYEIAPHGHYHITASDPTLTEEYISDNIEHCANLLRKLYGNPNKEMIYAYPHGSLPVIGNCAANTNACLGNESGYGSPLTMKQGGIKNFTGCTEQCNLGDPNKSFSVSCNNGEDHCCLGQVGETCTGTKRNMILKTMENNFIGARGTNVVSGIKEWPLPLVKPIDPSTPAPTGYYPTSDWGFPFSPIWEWPYQIDINPGDSSDVSALCNDYKNQLYQSLAVDGSMLIMAGHDFNPTDESGITNIDCNGPCPPDVAEITKGCYINSSNCDDANSDGSLSMYEDDDAVKRIFKDVDWSRRKNEDTCGLVPPTDSTKSCSCCDACFSPMPGSCLIELFDEVTKNKDSFWFATYTEIVAYVYNRTNSELKFRGKNTYELVCNKMFQCDITISFSGISSARVDGNRVNVMKDNVTGKTYIKFRPKSNRTHIIKVE